MTGFVYGIAESGGALKIGVSVAPEKRLLNLQRAHPRTLTLVFTFGVADPYAVERIVHAHFADKRLLGEWFEVDHEAARGVVESAIAGRLRDDGVAYAGRACRSLLPVGHFRPIIAMWGTRQNFAEAVGVDRRVAQQWWIRDNIPATHFSALLDAARRAGHSYVTLNDLLARCSARKRSTAKPHAEREGVAA